jgi:hypothetical protein
MGHGGELNRRSRSSRDLRTDDGAVVVVRKDSSYSQIGLRTGISEIGGNWSCIFS